MKFQCALFTVNDIEVSKKFYKTVLGQKIKYDFGENITFEGDFSIQQKDHYANMVCIDPSSVMSESHNAELYFETDDFDMDMSRLQTFGGIEYLHPVVTHDWGQRTVRFYDPDGHIIEIGESMDVVIARFLKEGNTPEQVAQKTQHPIHLVHTIHKQLYKKE